MNRQYKNILFVFALKEEATDKFKDKETLFIGVGKVNAAYKLTKRIIENRPDLIVNLGSAGSSHFSRESIVCCTQFIQRDMNAEMIGCKKYETPFSAEKAILEYGIDVPSLEKGICGTGDSFEMSHNTDFYNVVDMEAYALAYVAKKEQIPFLCLKYISDGADESAADEWQTMVHKAAIKLRVEIDKLAL